MQKAANSITNRATEDYPRYELRNRAVSIVDMGPHSESKDNNKACPFGERTSGDNDNCWTYDPEQVTRCRLNAYCSSHSKDNAYESNCGGEEVMTNYVCAASRLGRYEEGNGDDTESTTAAHDTKTDERDITTDQIRGLTNQLENLAPENKNKLTAILLKHQGNFTMKPGKCVGFHYTFQVQGQLPKSTYSRPCTLRLATSC